LFAALPTSIVNVRNELLEVVLIVPQVGPRTHQSRERLGSLDPQFGTQFFQRFFGPEIVRALGGELRFNRNRFDIGDSKASNTTGFRVFFGFTSDGCRR
jgi:hypothetical protein